MPAVNIGSWSLARATLSDFAMESSESEKNTKHKTSATLLSRIHMSTKITKISKFFVSSPSSQQEDYIGLLDVHVALQTHDQQRWRHPANRNKANTQGAEHQGSICSK